MALPTPVEAFSIPPPVLYETPPEWPAGGQIKVDNGR